MQDTSIEWTDKTSNPFKARHRPFDADRCPRCEMSRDKIGKLFNFCVKISPGCAACYACALTHRWGGPDYIARMKECLEPVLVEKELEAILKAKVPPGTKVFPFDMTDLFFEFWPDEFLDKFFAVAALRPDITFQCLTKRAEQMYRYFTEQEISKAAVISVLELASKLLGLSEFKKRLDARREWAATTDGLPNVWLGVSCEDQKTADERIPWLLKTPAAVRFVSYEPALGPVDFTDVKTACGAWATGCACTPDERCEIHPRLDLIIIGGESGPHARPFNIQWAADVIRQCTEADIACFTKQLGSCPVMNEDEWRVRPGTLILNPRNRHKAPEGTVPILLHDSKGGDMNEWLPYLRVRELPEVGR